MIRIAKKLFDSNKSFCFAKFQVRGTIRRNVIQRKSQRNITKDNKEASEVFETVL